MCGLDASDEFLKERVMNLPESVVAGTHYSQDRFLRALSNYRDINTDDETVYNYFDEIEIHPIYIGWYEVTSKTPLNPVALWDWECRAEGGLGV